MATNDKSINTIAKEAVESGSAVLFYRADLEALDSGLPAIHAREDGTTEIRAVVRHHVHVLGCRLWADTGGDDG